MATTVTVITNINRTYLKNKTKDEIIDLLLYILETRCEADTKIERLEAIIKPINDKPCVWTLDNSFMDSDIWETDCGNSFIFDDDGPEENGFRFCPYCRREVCENIIKCEDGE